MTPPPSLPLCRPWGPTEPWRRRPLRCDTSAECGGDLCARVVGARAGHSPPHDAAAGGAAAAAAANISLLLTPAQEGEEEGTGRSDDADAEDAASRGVYVPSL